MKYLLILSLLYISPVYAADEPADKGALISLSTTSTLELPNDVVVVRYRIEASGPKADALLQQVNRISQAVHSRLKKEKGLKQATLSRRMEMLWRRESNPLSSTGSSKRVRDGWRLVQQEQVISSKLDAVLDWVDFIEKAGAHLDSLGFQISERVLKPATEKLQLQAIQKFRTKAGAVAKALDAKSFRITHLQTGSQMPTYNQHAKPEMMLMTARADAPPSFNAGEGKLSVTVSGQILLPEKDFHVQ